MAVELKKFQKTLYNRFKKFDDIENVNLFKLNDSITELENQKKQLKGNYRSYIIQELIQLKAILNLKNKFEEGDIDKETADLELKKRIDAIKHCVVEIEAMLKRNKKQPDFL